MATYPTFYRRVAVILGSEPELRSCLNGQNVTLTLPATNNKQYDFLVDPALELAPGDFVVCQVRSSFTFGIVMRVGDASTDVSHEDYMHNVVLGEGAYKLIVARVDWEPVKLAIRTKRLYDKKKREIEQRSKVNPEALSAALSEV
jgi:hypothetical protein